MKICQKRELTRQWYLIAKSVLSELSLFELWIDFGKTTNRKYIPIHEIVKPLGSERAGWLTLFHSLIGRDQVFFLSCGKRTAWKTWQNYPQLTESLVKLCNNPTADDIESELNAIERFVCLMYHAASTKHEVNKCRRQIFAQYGRQLENLPLPKFRWSSILSQPCIKNCLLRTNRWYQCRTFQIQINEDGASKEIFSCHAG